MLEIAMPLACYLGGDPAAAIRRPCSKRREVSHATAVREVYLCPNNLPSHLPITSVFNKVASVYQIGYFGEVYRLVQPESLFFCPRQNVMAFFFATDPENLQFVDVSLPNRFRMVIFFFLPDLYHTLRVTAARWHNM